MCFIRSVVNRWKIFSWAYGGLFLSSVCALTSFPSLTAPLHPFPSSPPAHTTQFIAHLIGAAFAATAPAVPSWAAGLGDGENFGQFLIAILEPIGGFGKFLVVLGALTVTAPCALDMYSFGEYLFHF